MSEISSEGLIFSTEIYDFLIQSQKVWPDCVNLEFVLM